MSYSATIANPVSLTSLNPNNIVSELEDALMQGIGQALQTGQSTNDSSLQQEMQLLAELLNQSNNTDSNPSQTGSSDPSTNSSNPSTSSGGTKHSTGLHQTESKLESALERDITKLLQNGQTANNSSALQQEMNLLIQLLGQGA